MRSSFVCLLIAGILGTASGTAQAFDGRRGGFILGFGLGPGFSHVSQTLTTPLGTSSGSEDKFGVASEFKIGAGIGERFQIYYVSRANWFSADNALGSSVIFTAGVGLVGASYYLEEQTPSFYLTGLVGLSSWDTPFEDSGDPGAGFGIGAGAGWEFARHFSIEATVNWGNPSTEESGVNLETTFTSLLVTINGIAY